MPARKPQQSERPVRLQKFLAGAGVASRRHAEELILAGRVLVNNEVADTLPAFVDPQRDEVRVNGCLVTVLTTQGRRIKKLRVRIVEDGEER